MAIAEIQAWLNGSRDFDQGKEIYFRLGANELIKQQLNLVQTSFLRKKLLKALTELNDEAKKKLKVKVAVEQSKTKEPDRNPAVLSHKIIAKPKINYDTLPPVLKERWMEKKKCWATINQYLYQLNKTTPENNVKLIKKIKKLDAEIDGIWKELDFHHHTGELLIKHSESNKPKHELQRALLNARSNVSRYKLKPGKEKLLKKWSDEVFRLTELLDESV